MPRVDFQEWPMWFLVGVGLKSTMHRIQFTGGQHLQHHIAMHIAALEATS